MPRTCVNQWNDSEKQMTLKFLGLAEGDFKETFLFRRGDSLPLVHTTEQVRFFFWGYDDIRLIFSVRECFVKKLSPTQ